MPLPAAQRIAFRAGIRHLRGRGTWDCCLANGDNRASIADLQHLAHPMTEPSEQQRRYREFVDLLPLTLSLAGLPASEHGKYYTEEQIESRLFTIRNAYKHARQIAREFVK